MFMKELEKLGPGKLSNPLMEEPEEIDIAAHEKPKENTCMNTVYNMTHTKEMDRVRSEKEDQEDYE